MSEMLSEEGLSQEGLADAPRLLILHYHTFKNAGSSVDEMLRRNFPGAWVEKEFSLTIGSSNAPQVEQFLAERTDLAAFSSHTAVLPLPRLPGVEVFPIFFVRHPFLRLKSAYTFERQQQAETHGAHLAKATDFRGYVETLLDTKNRQTRDFQTYRLSFGDPDRHASEVLRAIRTLDMLPFVGLVEAYEESLKLLEHALSSKLPHFKAVLVHRNATKNKPEMTLDQQIQDIRTELGSAIYLRLVDANRGDLQLFEIVAGNYGMPGLEAVRSLSA